MAHRIGRTVQPENGAKVAKILLAEDDESMRAFLTKALSRVGHEVCSVSDGFEALPHIEDGEFDLLVTDIVMPGMDGLELD